MRDKNLFVSTPGYSTKRTLCIVALCVVGAFGCYKAGTCAYHYGKQYVENKVMDEIVNDVVIAFTTKATLDKLSPEKKEELLRKKAKLITMRKRVLQKLEEQAKNEPTLSQAHRAALSTDVELAQAAFGALDYLRAENPFEDEYANASTIDALIENRIIASLISATKPEEERTPEELKDAEHKKELQARLLDRLKDKIPSLALNALKNSPLLLTAMLEN